MEPQEEGDQELPFHDNHFSQQGVEEAQLEDENDQPGEGICYSDFVPFLFGTCLISICKYQIIFIS